MMHYLFILIVFLVYILAVNIYSYKIQKRRILKSQVWDLNICCGKTDGGGINADIFIHKKVPDFIHITDIYNLPFENKQFGSILCSHTMEHVDDPNLFFNELIRVGGKITIVVPPLYDIAAVFNFFEHKWIFLSFKTKHDRLPTYMRLPFSSLIQKILGQIIHV